MKLLSDVFFFGYSGLLVVAGLWGAVSGRRDQRWLFGLDIDALDRTTSASLVSQYRFMRAVEAGFGIFAIVFYREIYTVRAFNWIFLGTMTGGVVARLISLRVDGRPRPLFYFFLVSEGLGAVIIFLHTRNLLVR